MALVVVGGQSRKVGKTSVITGLISALAPLNWTAIKITPHEHGLQPEQRFAISEEAEPTGSKDTSRYLAAGARRALLVQARPENIQEAMSAIIDQFAGSGNTIIESNAIVGLVRPDLYLIVLEPSLADFKQSARRRLERADAIVASEGAFSEEVAQELAGKPVFRVTPPTYVSPELVKFVRERLERAP
jgi:hypothetical protein